MLFLFNYYFRENASLLRQDQSVFAVKLSQARNVNLVYVTFCIVIMEASLKFNYVATNLFTE